MSKLTGAEIVIQCLREQGVDTVFGYPGGAILNIYDALYKHQDEITHILTSHEQGASHAADGYARSTGKVGVCLATSGPGATNLVTGIATAYMDSVPVVAITCNVGTKLLGKDSFQEIDITGVTMPITKYNFIVKDVGRLAQVIRRAFTIAQTGRPGPVLIDITKDVTEAQCDYEYQAPAEIVRQTDTITEEDMDRAVEMIRNSRKPFIFVGGGAVIAGASEELIVVGARFSDRVTGNASKFAKNAKILQIDVDRAEINKNIRVTASIVGDAKTILRKLNARLDPVNHDEWIAHIERMKDMYPLRYDKRLLTGPYIIQTIDELTPDDAIIVTEVGQHQMWAAQYYNFRKPRTFITSGGLGTMGFGLGASIGTKIGNPDRVVVNIAGDGCFRMNMNEIATAARYKVHIIEVIINNHVLGMVRQWQTLFYGKRYSQTVLNDNVDYVKLSEAMGAAAYRVTQKEEFAKIFQEAMEKEGPVVIDCQIGCDDKVFPMVSPGAPIADAFDDTDLKIQ